jgi:RimJ/RimL family protein N-acetyltransferase
MIIQVSDEIILSQIDKKDKPALIKYLNDLDIYNNTLNIPHPYKPKDADWWIKNVNNKRKETGRLTNFVIRDKNMNLIGGIGFHLKYGINSHKDEIGYWLGREFWNKGIMTSVVKKICELGFFEMKLIRMEAIIFEYNKASARVLEKCGFIKEGVLRKYILKDGKILDGLLYAVVKEK